MSGVVVASIVAALFVFAAVVGMWAEGNPYDKGPDRLRLENWLE